MYSAELLSKIRSLGLDGTLKKINPVRIYNHLMNKRAGVQMREVFLRDLARMWCGQEESVAEIRAELLRSTLETARNNVPYYRKHFDEAGIHEPNADDLRRLPLLNKSMIREHSTELLHKGWQNHAHYRMNTGGSTGQPLEFIVAGLGSQAANLHQEFAFRLMGFRNGDRIAAFDGASIADELRHNNVFWVPRPNHEELPYGSVRYSSHYMDYQTLPYYFKSLEEEDISFIYGYPSAVHKLARYCLSNYCYLRKPIKSVQLTSEIILDSQISDIENAFQTKVYLQYGMSEVSIYAHTFDTSHEYLCSPLMGWVEVLDDNGIQVNTGEEGEVVATGFHNHLMPFLRYQTGDRAIYGGERDGVVVLKKVLGRSQDYVVRTDGTKLSITGLIFGQHFKSFGNIARWQIFQDEPGKVTIRIIPLSGFGQEDKSEIIDKFRNLANISVVIELVDAIPLTSRGKHLFVIQMLS